MVAAGAVDPRRKETVPSMTQLAERAGVAVETVRRMINGDGSPEPENVDKVADALEVDRLLVSRWVDHAREISEAWAPPSESALLNADERQALDRLIRVMTAERRAHPSQESVVDQGDATGT